MNALNLVGLISALAAQAAGGAQPATPAAARMVKLTNIETSYPNWSPDGRRLVYQSNRSGNSEIYIMNADGSGVVRLTDHPATDENPSWSPDGTRIAFRSYRDGNAEIYTMAPDGTGLRNLTNHASDDIHPYWSPDGSRIVFNSNRSLVNGKPVPMIFSMRSDGTDVRQISRDGLEDTYAQLSPDGTRIVLRRRLEEESAGWERNPGNSEIFLMNADGTNARRLTNHPGFDGWPSWSPDGSWIAYAGEGAGDYQILLMRPDGTAARALTHGPGSFTKPIFSPDGRKIICTRTLDGNVEIFLIELAGESTITTPLQSGRALLDRGVAQMGGIDTLEKLPVLATGYHMLERSLGQGERPHGAVASSVQVGKREASPQAQREHLQMRRHMSGGRVYDRTLDAGRWHRLSTRAEPSNTGSIENILSAAVTALHPESLLPRLLTLSNLDASLQQPRVVDNRHMSVVLTRFAGLPLTLLFNDEDGLLGAVEWQDPDLTGIDQQPLRISFAQYRPAIGLPGAPRLPHLVEVWRGAELWQVRSYDEYTPAAEDRFGRDTPTSAATTVTEAEIAPGAFHVRTADYGSLMIDTPDRVIVIDLPDSQERGRAVLDLARRRAAGRPISVVLTHLHDDHLGGLAGAGGFEILADERLLEDVRRYLASRNARDVTITGVRGTHRIGDGARGIELRTVPHSHAVGSLVAFLPATGVLYEADLIRGLLPHSTFELVSWVESSGLKVRTVVSSHGTAQPWERVVAAAQAWRSTLAGAPLK